MTQRDDIRSTDAQTVATIRRVHHAVSFVYLITLLTGFIALQSIIFLFVLPKLREVFAEFDVELPHATNIMLDISAWLTQGSGPGSVPGWYFALPMIILAAIVIIAITYRFAYFFYLVLLAIIVTIIAQLWCLGQPLYHLTDNFNKLGSEHPAHVDAL